VEHPAATPDDLLGGTVDATPPGLAGAGADGLSRRRILSLGSAGVALSAVLAACGSVNTGAGSAGAPATTTTTRVAASSHDITTLRTLSSIEALLVKVYQSAIDANLVKTQSISDAVKAMQGHHKQHLSLVQRATEHGGGTAFTDPNPVLLARLQTRLVSLRNEQDVVRLAYDVERLSSQTYQVAVSSMDNTSLYEQLMQIAGSEAGHVALLSVLASSPPTPVGTPDGAFGATDQAVGAGTGV